MLRSVFCMSIFLLFSLVSSPDSLFGQEAPRIEIHQVVPAGMEGKPQIFNVRGMATIPSGMRREDVTVIVYTRSGGGGNVQLQMLGTEPNREPRTAEWDSDKWEIEIWLGTEKEFDSFYWVYSVAIQNFDMTDSQKLISLTHDRYTNFKDDVVDVLKQGKFNPLVWTQKRVRREK